MQARFTLDLPQGCAERGLWQWYRNQTLVYLHTALCARAKVAQHSISGNVPQREEKELLIARWTGRPVSAVQPIAPEQLQSIRSLAQALQTAQITGPWRGAGSCYTSPCHGEPLLKPCSIFHCFCGGQKADLRLERVLVLTRSYDLSPHFAALHFADYRIQDY